MRPRDVVRVSHVRTGFAHASTWCVQPTYGTALVAQGRTTGPAHAGVMPVALTPVLRPLLSAFSTTS